MKNRCTIITRVYTDQGIVGEAYNADTDEDQYHIVSLIENNLAPRLIGLDASRSEACWSAMLLATFDQLAHRWLTMQAVACVDTAIWDAIGKSLDVPLWKLWGGAHETISIIGIGGYYCTGAPGEISIEDDVRHFVDLGVAGMKFKIGGRTPQEDAERMKIAVASAPADFFFSVDANQGYTLAEALEFARLTEDVVSLRWFEEPCRWYNDIRSMHDFRLISGIPVSAGQSEISRHGMSHLINSGAIDISNFDASWGGGPTEWRRVAAHAAIHDMGVGHHEEAHLSIHLLASVPHGTCIEVFHPDRDPIYWNMIENLPTINNGEVAAPLGAGLGLNLDADYIKRYRVDK
ncbi:MAG: mandelate racemase/muconate lactonizing enzyme family protein [Candidatus Berkelbacteria bacterium]|nr:mandelate racemase/muconate lactonizing enzyme family protein [Candidatus Berkelbacteria bacterium]